MNIFTVVTIRFYICINLKSERFKILLLFKLDHIEVLSQFSRNSGVEMRILKSKMEEDLDVSRNDSFQMKQLMDEKCAIIHSKITESVTSFEF